MASQKTIEQFFGKRKNRDADNSENNLEFAQQTVTESNVTRPTSDVTREDRPSTSNVGRGLASGNITEDTASAEKKTMKHASTFVHSWKESRPWLTYVPNEGMFCSYCQKYDKTPFGREVWNKVGCKRIRLESVKNHEVTAEHRDSMATELIAQACTNIADQIGKPDKISEDSMVKVFQCLYFLCKNNIPHTTILEKLLDLETQLGLNIKQKICKGANAQYTSNTSIKEFCNVSVK